MLHAINKLLKIQKKKHILHFYKSCKIIASMLVRKIDLQINLSSLVRACRPNSISVFFLSRNSDTYWNYKYFSKFLKSKGQKSHVNT